jgi:hypothetical protein
MIIAICMAICTVGAILIGRNELPKFLVDSPNFSFARFRDFLLVIFGITVSLVLWLSLKALPAKCDLSSPESSIVFSAQLSARTGRLYSDWHSFPYTSTPYGPFFYLSLQLVAHFVGTEADKIRHGYRILDLSCFLLLPCLVFSLLRQLRCTPALAVLASLASISASFFFPWTITARPDIPALLLSILAVWILCRHDEPQPAHLILAGVACAAAILFKQSSVAAPLAISLLLFVRRRFKDLFIFGVSAAMFGSAALGYYIARGEPVLLQNLLLGKSPIDLRSSINLISSFLSTGFGLVVIVLGCAGFWIAVSSADWRLKFLGYYFFFSTLIGFTTFLHVGAGCNYLFETWVAAALLLPTAFARLESLWNAAHPGLRLASCILLLALLLQQCYVLKSYYAQFVWNYDATPLNGLRVLSTLSYLTLHGKDPHVLDPFALTTAEEHGLWSPDPILKEIAGQDFDVVVLSEANHQLLKYRGQDFFSPVIISGLRANYQIMCRTSSLIVLRPKSREIPFTAAEASRVLDESCYADGDRRF